ncbi:glycosyltransferase [Diaminobutyricimonas sp. LJ205]|uniref:glycosyltransferase n=1 Tax=Diaminobutyricimonas sp. LJ205 TaxID=2683590 RepID=UPI003519FB72
MEKSEYSFDFVALSGEGGSLEPRLIEGGHSVFRCRQSIRSIMRLARLMRDRNIRVAHIHLGAASALPLLAAVLAGVRKRVVHFRSDTVGGRRTLAKSVRLAASRAAVGMFATDIVGVSPGSLSSGWRARWRSDPRCRVIPNGIDAGEIREKGAKGSSLVRRDDALIRVANVGRVDPDKNRARAVRIWAALAREHPASMDLVGDINEDVRATIHEVANEVVGPYLRVVGDSSDVPSYLYAADVLLVTSVREGLPGVVLESLACGTPVVSSALPGVEWIRESVPGVTVVPLEARDEDWAAALVSAKFADREAIRNGFDVGPFTMDVALANFLDLWGLSNRTALSRGGESYEN